MDAETIAKWLSEAQRKSVVDAKEAVWGRDNYLISTLVASRTWQKLVDFGLIAPTVHSRSLTPFGLAVRDILLRDQ